MLMVSLITKASVKTPPSEDTRINEFRSPGSSCSFKSVATLISVTSGANNNDLVHYTMFSGSENSGSHIYADVPHVPPATVDDDETTKPFVPKPGK